MAQKTIDIEQDILGPIGSLKKDVDELADKKITKFYASNNGETHIADSDKGLIQDMVIYGRSEQFMSTGAQLYNNDVETTNRGVSIKVKNGIITFNGTVSDDAHSRVIYSAVVTLQPGTYFISSSNSKIVADFLVDGSDGTTYYKNIINVDGTEKKIHTRIMIGLSPSAKGDIINETGMIMMNKGDVALPWEPYTGGIPSPNPDYPQEIKSVVNPVVKVCGKNLLNEKRYHANYSNGIFYIKNMNKVVYPYKPVYETFGICGMIECKKGKTYVFSCTNPNKNMSMGISEYETVEKATTRNDNVGYARATNYATTKIRYTAKSNGVLVCGIAGIWLDGTTNLHICTESELLQVEESEDATPYEPYTEQTIQLPCTLNAIPVSNNGNVTIDGQQYIADRVVEKDGVFGIERNIREIHTNTKTMNNSEEYPGWNLVEGIADATYYNEQVTGSSRMLTFITNITRSTLHQNNIKNYNIVFWIRDNIGYSQSELIAKAIDVDIYIRLQDAIFEPLPGDIQAKLRTLVTNYPVTNISVTSDQLDGYTVFNYPISMQNGWNYVKQQLGDTREYIYDMQTQLSDTEYETAMAYVNSEYAVALAELNNM